MRSSPIPAHVGSRRTALRFGLTCISILVCAYSAAQPVPADPESAPIVVTDAPAKLPKKHREIKPGVAKPKAHISKPQHLIKSLRQSRSAS